MTKLCPRGKAAAKRKFRVYPSAYANAYASKICAGKIKDPSGVKRKDFRGKKAEGGKVSGRINLKKKTKKKKMFKRDGVYFDRPQPKNTFDLSNPPKRIDVAGGGLMEATARLKRQGLKDGKKVFPTHPSREQEARDYYTKLYGSKEAKAELGERTRDRRKVKKMGGGMISKPRAMYRKGGGADTGKKGEGRSRLLTAFMRSSPRTRGSKRAEKMGGGMMRPMYRKGGGVCLRGMNREAIGKNS